MLPAYGLINSTSDCIPVRLLSLHPHSKLKRGRINGFIDEQLDSVQLASIDADRSFHHYDDDFKPSQLIDLSNVELGETQRSSILSLVDEFGDIFSAGEGDIGHTGLVQHEIVTEHTAPKHIRNYRQPHTLREEAQRQVNVLLKQGIIEPSSSPWNSPILLVPKKDGSYRFCVDFRALNSITQICQYPLPRVDECIESMFGSEYFSTLDLASGYWQVEVKPEDRPKTAFSTTSGHYQFCTMPMGLSGAPATFQRLMDLVLCGLHWRSILVYLDDIIVFARTFQEHQDYLL